MLWPQFLLALALDLASGAPPTPLVVSRHYHGDLFTFEHRSDECDASFCYDWGGLSATVLDGPPCRCRCEPPYPTYREDIGACVNDVQECHLADFSMGDTQEKVPFVFLPERGQLVHPSAEITMSGLAPADDPVVSPVCVVSGSEVMTRSGWQAINSTFEPPFRLRRDQGKTFLQWVGEGVSAAVIEGRLVLVRLLCKDAGNALRARFSPCVAFRVAGTQGQAAAATQESDSSGGSLAVGLSVGAILVLYIVAMAGYFVYRRRKRRAGHQLIEDALMGKGRRSETSGGGGGGRERQSRRKKEDKDDKDEPTDLTQRPVSSLSHGSAGSSEVNERLPEDTLLALVDAERDGDLLDEEEDMSAANVQLRRRLYFNPAFFDPDQLHDPPPGALEFLVKIREMITIAKLKMQAKQYQPSLPVIAEVAEEAEAEAAAEAEEAEEPAEDARCSPDRGSVDIDRWLETVVRESNSDDGGPLYSDSLPRPRRQKAAAPAPPPLAASPVTAAAAAAAAAPRGVTTSWRQQARQQRDEAESDTIVGASGDERRNNASFDSDDTLNDIVSEAESKVPKLHSDEDSVYSEVRTAARRRRVPGADGVYEEINISDRSLSAFSGEYTSVSINGDGTVIRTGGKMTIEVDDPAVGSDAESEEEVFDPDTLEKRRIRVRKARRVRRKPSFYDDSLERRKRGVNYEERFETTHINVNTVLNTSVESTESVYKRWGSVASGSEANSVYSRINFVTSKQQKQQEQQQQDEKSGLVVGNLRHSQRNLKTFKDYSTVKFGGRTSLLEQWKKKNDQQRADSAASESAPTLPVTSPAPSMSSPTPTPSVAAAAAVHSPAPSAASALRRQDSSGGRVQANSAEPTPPIPPKAAAAPTALTAAPAPPAPVTAPAAAAAAAAPPLPPRTHSPQRERSFLRSAAPQPPQRPPASSLPPPRPAREQPPLPPKSAAPPPPLPSKTRAPAPPPPPPPPPPPTSSPPPPPSGRRYFLGQIDGAADDEPRRRRNSAGESETNSTASSCQPDEAGSTGSAGTDKSEPGSHTLGRQVEARLERHLQRSYSASDVSRSEIESLASSRSSLRSPQRCSPNVLERITECESAIRRGASAGTGMAIALSLKERQAAAAVAERERPNSIRDKWRRLVEPPSPAAAATAPRDDSGYQSTDSAESHLPPLATPGGIRRLVKKFDRSDAAEQAAASRTRWVHVAQ